MFDYSYVPFEEKDRCFVLHTNSTDKSVLQNQETLLCQGNGYLGIRGCFEEEYMFQKRNAFICGTYNKSAENEVSELPNCADVVNMQLILGGQAFSLFTGTVESYSKTFYLRTGELTRDVVWKAPDNTRYQLCFRRFLSLDNLHLFVSQVSVTPLDSDCQVEVEVAINGTVTNTGTQHFLEGPKRVHDLTTLGALFTTTQSNIDISVVSAVLIDGVVAKGKYLNKRRMLSGKYCTVAQKGKPLVIERRSMYHTSVDNDHKDCVSSEDFGKTVLREYLAQDYNTLLAQSSAKWDAYWDNVAIKVEGLAQEHTTILHAALYHMRAMTAFHDDRVSIGAKGLTGEGYKGHIFWDTEICMVPHFILTNPQVAKNLLKYRYFRMDEARANAAANNFLGAQFPWESADSGAEETPEFAAINIHTGKPTPIENGKKEVHITADIAFEVYQYYLTTGDLGFMLDYGCEMVIECAIYWSSRCVLTGRGYELLDVIGPDEYTECIDNNTYTNMMVKENLSNALHCIQLLKNSERRYQELEDKLYFEHKIPIFEEIINNMFLAYIENDIIPQDDSFLSKPTINIEKYKADAGAQTILFDYNRKEVVDMQVLKQADVVMLLYLMPAVYPNNLKIKNLDYYEQRTIHDSSLSKCIHAIVAMDCGVPEMAKEFWESSMKVDFGPRVGSIDGIHSAAIFGIWNMFIRGMCGICVDGAGRLLMKPNLVGDVQSIETSIWYRGRRIHIRVDKNTVMPRLVSGKEVVVYVHSDGMYRPVRLLEDTDGTGL